ncbi:MAG TPA: isoprenylcysteine carboxylmethyltransferase family protein [Ignavibacteria bacterium]|nr:isoprenylcysteine carboxylmethyltransferase family protein [Ignavibacteria bacterium]
MLKKIGNFLFKNRSYTPLPWVFLMILFMSPNLTMIIIGAVFVIIGELIRWWAVSYAGSETRTTGDVGGSYLVTQGPFGIVRNPLYIGNITIYAGIGIMSNAIFPWLMIAAFLYFVFQYYCIIINEEEYLQNTFKDKFTLYKSKVNRFVPVFTKLPEELNSNLVQSWKDGFDSEKRSLTSIVIVCAIIVIFYILKISIISF